MHNVDHIVSHLTKWAYYGRRLPPAWDGAQISTPVCGSDGQWIGRILPGRGMTLGMDLKHLGIHKPIPYLYERTPVEKMREAMARIWPEFSGRTYYDKRTGKIVHADQASIRAVAMQHAARFLQPGDVPLGALAAITTYDGIINARAGGNANDIVATKLSFTTVAQTFSTLFRAGGAPVAGTYTNIPGGAVHTRASVGAWSNGLSDPGANKKYLLTFGHGATVAIDWAILVDLLVACGNISASIATSQTINSATQTRQHAATLGAGVMATFDVTTALGTGTGTFSLTSYTDQDGNTAQVSDTGTSGASVIAMRLIPTGGNAAIPFMTLASGDFGVRSVETFAFSAAHSAGVIALNLVYPLAYVPGLAANIYVERDSTVQIDGLTELVKDGSNVIGCLTVYIQANTTTSGAYRAFMRSCAG